MSARLVNGQALPHPAMRLLRGVALIVCCLLVVLPFLGIVSTSLAGEKQLNANGGFVFLPTSIDLTAYRAVLSGGVATQAIVVSIVVTLGGTLISLLVSTLMAYSLSVRGMAGRGFFVGLLVASLLFSPGMIPVYLTVKASGMLDSLWALIIPSALNAFNVIVLRAFFMNIPGELIESAKIDGASEWVVLRRIVLPISRAVIAVVGLFYAVGYWNAFFNALLYINDTDKWPLPLVLRTFVINNTQLGTGDLATETLPPQPALQMAILVISIVPILIAYPFLQRHFRKGVLTGAVKG
jgi:putative aldouronate transport system permease protein